MGSLFLAAETPDYSEALQAIQQQLENINVAIASGNEIANMTCATLAGIVCFLGMLYGIKLLTIMFDRIWK